jgi:conjugative transfer signal peptidase TraF
MIEGITGGESLSLTDSQPYGIYRRIPLNGQLKHGELVLFKVPDQASPYVYGRGWLPKGWLLLKNVGALPGDRFTISNHCLMINNKYIGPVFKQDSKSKPMPRLRGCYQVPKGYFLPISTHIKKSFDGRYFGAISTKLIVGKAKPVIIF